MNRINIGNLQAEDDVNIGEINIPLITPKRGVDYWTPQDKQEVVTEAVTEINAVITPQEQQRQNNETTRQNNETTRQNNETTRQSNETTRQSNEATRQENEATRIENETAREERFTEIETLVGNLEDDVEEMQGDISDIQAEQTQQNTNISANATAIASLQTNKANKDEIPTKTSELTNDSGFIDKSVNDLVNYTLKTNTGSLIDLEINSTTYVITLSLKNQDGTVISTDTIDLPLESVVVGGSYDAVNKKIVLTLENGNTVDIPVGDLIAGLQTEITSQNKLASDLVDDTNSGNKFVTTSEKQAWNAKYDKPVGGIPSTDLASDVLTDYVKNTDYATSQKGGAVKIAPTNYGIILDPSGYINVQSLKYNDYLSKGNYYAVGKGTLENVIEGKDLTTKAYVDSLVGDLESILETLDVRKRGVVYEYKFKNNRNRTTHRQRIR